METNINIPTRAELEQYRRRSDKDGFLHILLFYILPFIVFNSVIFILVTATPKVSITVAETGDYLTTEVTIRTQSLLPLKSITADLDGEIIDLGKKEKGAYTIVIAKNGLLDVELTGFNGMKSAQYEHIDILDDTPPVIENAHVDDGIVTITFTDSQSGINIDSVHAADSVGQTVKPLNVDPSTNTFSFTMDPAGLRVSGQDRAGNAVQGVFTSHKEGGSETLDSSIEAIEE